MPSRVVEHVVQRVAHFARRLQHVCVVAITEHGPAALPLAVERACDPHAQPLHAASQRSLIVGLANEVHVIGQDCELDEPHAESIGAGHEGFSHDRILASTAKVLQTACDAQRDMQRMAGLQRWSRRMCHTCALAFTLATGAWARAAPRFEFESSLMQRARAFQLYDERTSSRAETNAFFLARE